jgi:pyridoxine 4-dehydrogenase
MPSAADAGTWTLGDLTVNRLGFGAMRLTGEAGSGPFSGACNRDQAVAVLRRAVELGVNHIDTAAFYFSGLRSANELINTALAPYADGLVITTKVGAGRTPDGSWHGMASPSQLRGQVEENIRQLGRDHMDVVNLRRVPSDVPWAELVGAMAELQTAGLIRQIGISNVGPEHLAQAQAVVPIVCVQNMFGLGAGPADRAFLRECGEQDVAFVPFFAIAGSRHASGGGDAGNDDVAQVAAAHGASPAQIRLAWTLELGPHVLAIPGTGNPAHMDENVAAAAIRLSPDEMALLDTVTAPEVEPPNPPRRS